MYDQYIFGRRLLTPYIVSENDVDRLRKKFRGKEKKVAAVVLSAQNEGYLTQAQIADLVGITRMTLFRWRTKERTFQREYERLSKKASSHYNWEARKRYRRRPSVSDVLSDERIYRAMLGL